MVEDTPPILTAVSSSARQLFQLLRCIAISNKAHVTIDDLGIRVACSDSSSMEASVLLEKVLFTTYSFHPPIAPRSPQAPDSDDEEEELDSDVSPNFQISLPALLETLQIFGLTDPNTTKPAWARDNPYPTSTAFSNNVLGMNNLCRISYDSLGSPLSIILTESSIRTTCDLTTYEPEYTDEIPFDRAGLLLKTVMRGSWLFDAISELASTSPEKLTMYAKMVKGKPFFALSAEGTLGSARIEFNNDPQPPPPVRGQISSSARRFNPRNPANLNANPADTAASNLPTNVLETFIYSHDAPVLKVSYKFSYVQKAARAMGVATKVSLRIDEQGVLSLQLMVELDAAGGGIGVNAGGSGDAGDSGKKKCFVDFRIVPLVDDEEDEEEGDDTFAGAGAGEDETGDEEL